jgi:predicted nucleotidyltransferase
MRTSPLADALFNRTRQQVLALTLLQPDRRWYQLELANRLGVRASSLQRELRILTAAGLLKRDQDGKRVYFQADTACPIFEDLSRILARTVGIVEALKEALEPFRDRIVVAFVYGSVADSSERTGSDVDLMVIGDVQLSEIAPALRPFERSLARPVNPTVFAPSEFGRRVARTNHFLTNVLGGKPLFIIGGQNELAQLTSGATTKNPPDEPTGTRRSARRG